MSKIFGSFQTYWVIPLCVTDIYLELDYFIGYIIIFQQKILH